MRGYASIVRRGYRATHERFSAQPRNISRASVRLLPVLALLWARPAALAEHPPLRTVALSGQSVPGEPDVVLGGILGPVLLNNRSDAALHTIMRSGGQSKFGILTERQGLKLVAVRGRQAPGVNQGEDFGEFHSLVLGDGGHVAFYGDLLSTSGTIDGIWSTRNGELALVARQGRPSPGLGTPFQLRNLIAGQRMVLNSAGSLAFIAKAPDARGVWSDRNGSLSLEVIEGTAAIGADDGAIYSGVGTALELNDANQLVYGSYTFNGSIAGAGLWRDKGAGYSPIVNRTFPVPGVPQGAFQYFIETALNEQGEIAFIGSMRPDPAAGITADNSGGIWVENEGNFQLIIRTNDVAPGANGAVFDALGNLQLDDGGDVAFKGWLQSSAGNIDSSNDRGIWKTREGVLALIAREGDQAPTLPTGVTFGVLGDPSLNGTGQVAFQSSLSDPGADSTDISDSLWATDRAGTVRLIVKAGDVLDVDSGPGLELREVAAVGFAERGAFNDLGQIAFVATFTDRSSGAFVSNLVAIPEPGGVVMLTAAWGLMMAAARQQRTACGTGQGATGVPPVRSGYSRSTANRLQTEP